MTSAKNKVSLSHKIILMLIPLACFIIRLIMVTIRFELRDPNGVAPQNKDKQSMIYAFWHNQQLLATYFFRNHKIRVLVSRSKDGDYIAKVLHHFGFGTVRSSSSQGKINALRGLARELKLGFDTAITPDGPRGPLYQAQPGAVFLAALSGHAIAPFGCAVNKVWRLSRTWDQFEIPKPFSRAVVIYGDPIMVPRKMSDEQSEAYRIQLQESMNRLREQAMTQLKVSVEA